MLGSRKPRDEQPPGCASGCMSSCMPSVRLHSLMEPTAHPETMYLPAWDTEQHMIGPAGTLSWYAGLGSKSLRHCCQWLAESATSMLSRLHTCQARTQFYAVSRAADLCVSRTVKLERRQFLHLVELCTAVLCCRIDGTGFPQFCLVQIQKMTTASQSYRELLKPQCLDTAARSHTAAGRLSL